MTQVNGKRFIVANKTTTTFELQDIDGNNVNTTSYTTYTSGGVFNRVYTLATPFETADLADLKFAQSADVMYICHPDYAIHKLSRTGHTSWYLDEVEFTAGPLLDHNIEVTTLTASATTGSGITITASDIVGINGDTGFQSTDVGRLIHLGTGKGLAKIITVSSTLIVVADVIETLSTTSATTDWALGAWSKTTGYPSCVSFFEQRLVFAGTTENPQTLYFSKSGDYENFDKVVVFWDGEDSTSIRGVLYPKYKQNRKLTMEEPVFMSYLKQKNRIKQYLEEVYIRQIEIAGREADDLIAYYCHISENEQKLIFSSDRDLTQLISEKVSIYSPSLKSTFKHGDKIKFDDFEFPHYNVKTLKILTGDKSDNIEGIYLLGEKTLVKFFPEILETEVSYTDILTRAEDLLKGQKDNQTLKNLLTGKTKSGMPLYVSLNI